MAVPPCCSQLFGRNLAYLPPAMIPGNAAMNIGFSGRTCWASCSFLLKCDGVAETLLAMNQVSSQVVFVEIVQVEITQFVVADLVGKHVMDGRQDLMGHRYRRALVPAASFESVKFVLRPSSVTHCSWGCGCSCACHQIRYLVLIEQTGHLLVQLADLLLKKLQLLQRHLSSRRYAGLSSVQAPSASHNCSGARNCLSAKAARAAGLLSPSASAFSMRRALRPNRSETRLDNLIWASSRRDSTWFCSRT
jgi:hypothetical protein